ncbi:hypothetical protein GJQ54_00130 [Oceanospirillaceae bacterium ASx5O]|nr:hypothetical protein GJQ54_00130 [Oceanospirillaceae bacterium ASx5O]
MRTLLLPVLLCCSLPALALPAEFRDCGANRDEALTNLATSLVADIRSEVRQTVSTSSFLGINLTSRKESLDQGVSTNLKLKGVEFRREDDGYCAYLKRDDLRAMAVDYHRQAQNYQLKNLPDEVRPRIRTLDQWQQDLEQIRLLGLLFPRDLPRGWEKQLASQQKTLANARAGLYPQGITVRVTGADARLTIAGKPMKSGEPLYLPVGQYQYQVSAPGFCAVTGKVSLDAKEDESIRVDMSRNRLPTLQLTTNKPGQVRLMADGQQLQDGKRLTLQRCDGEVAVALTYHDGSETISRDSRYSLKPGREITDHFRFYSRRELNQLEQLSNQFSRGERLEIKYGYTWLPSEYEDFAGAEFDGMHQLKINYLQMNTWLRHGPGIMVGRSGDKISGDLLYNLGLQFTNMGEGRPLHVLGKVAFVPFVNLQLGVGYHQFGQSDTDISLDTFREQASDEEDDLVRDYLVARVGAGLDISLTRWIGVQLYADKSFTQENSVVVGAGLTLKLP